MKSGELEAKVKGLTQTVDQLKEMVALQKKTVQKLEAKIQGTKVHRSDKKFTKSLLLLSRALGRGTNIGFMVP